MPRGLPKEVHVHLEKARESALLAVEVYNKPATKFRSGGFIVLMVIAWTSLFHAYFLRKGEKPFYRKRGSTRYEKRDGDYKTWELGECARQFFGDQHSPIHKNLDFIAGLRHKIEHRSMPELDHRIFGECQALLFNFEDFLFQQFGAQHALNESLSLALQFSHLRDERQAKAVAKLHGPIRKDVHEYITQFRSSLSQEEFDAETFSYRVILIPKVVSDPKRADAAVEFVKFDPNKPEEMEKYQHIVALTKPSVLQASNVGKLKPSDVCKAVEPIVQKVVGAHAKFNASYHHVAACRYYNIRPKNGDGDPRKTDTRYCHYDEAHKDYVYNAEWKKFLMNEMKKPGQYKAVVAAYKT